MNWLDETVDLERWVVLIGIIAMIQNQTTGQLRVMLHLFALYLWGRVVVRAFKKLWHGYQERDAG